MKKRTFLILCLAALLTAVLLLLTGCGGGEPKKQAEEAPAAETVQAAPAEETEAPQEETAGTEAEEGLLRTAIRYDITTMDVAKTTDDYMIPMNVFDRLFETRVVDGNAQVVPSLCREYKVSEDGLTYDFTLLDGVVFSNGNALTASDVQYTFERLLILANQNTDIPLEVAGGQELMDKKAETLSGFRVDDDTHFSVTLNAPNAGFPAELSSPAMSIVDRESMTDGFGTDPAATIGTGPYIVTEWVTNDHYTMVYNVKYRGPDCERAQRRTDVPGAERKQRIPEGRPGAQGCGHGAGRGYDDHGAVQRRRQAGKRDHSQRNLGTQRQPGRHHL